MHDDVISILLVDDSDALAAEHVRICQLLSGVSVVGIARNGAEAIRLIKTARPDLVLMDLVMPDIDGFTALRLIAKGLPGTRIVVVSSRADEADVSKQCKANGAVAVLKKPLSAAAVSELIAAERSRRAGGQSAVRGGP